METKLFDRVAGRLELEHLSDESFNRTADKVLDLFKRAGVVEEIGKIPEDRLNIVTDGVVALWKIDSIGRGVEKMDEEKLQGSEKSPETANDAVRKQVKGELDEIGRNYHGVIKEWLPESFKLLIGVALEKDPKRMSQLKEGVMFGPDHYVTRLNNAGEFYKNVISGVYPPEERDSMDKYLAGEREESVYQMRSTFNTRLSGVIASL
jgi:hypothetical protein